MHRQVHFLGASIWTLFTPVRLFACMSHHMPLEICATYSDIRAHAAWNEFISSVPFLVVRQCAAIACSVWAHGALVRFFSTMRAHVICECLKKCKLSWTDWASKRPLAAMSQHVSLIRCPIPRVVGAEVAMVPLSPPMRFATASSVFGFARWRTSFTWKYRSSYVASIPESMLQAQYCRRKPQTRYECQWPYDLIQSQLCE